MSPPELSQLQRARSFSGTLHELFPHLSASKEGLQKILSEAPDGSIDEVARKQFEEVQKSVSDLLLSLLFCAL